MLATHWQIYKKSNFTFISRFSIELRQVQANVKANTTKDENNNPIRFRWLYRFDACVKYFLFFMSFEEKTERFYHFFKKTLSSFRSKSFFALDNSNRNLQMIKSIILLNTQRDWPEQVKKSWSKYSTRAIDFGKKRWMNFIWIFHCSQKSIPELIDMYVGTRKFSCKTDVIIGKSPFFLSHQCNRRSDKLQSGRWERKWFGQITVSVTRWWINFKRWLNCDSHFSFNFSLKHFQALKDAVLQ